MLNFFESSSLLHFRQPLYHYSSEFCRVNIGRKCSRAGIERDESGHLEYENCGNSNRKFWSNGTRPGNPWVFFRRTPNLEPRSPSANRVRSGFEISALPHHQTQSRSQRPRSFWSVTGIGTSSWPDGIFESANHGLPATLRRIKGKPNCRNCHVGGYFNFRLLCLCLKSQ